MKSIILKISSIIFFVISNFLFVQAFSASAQLRPGLFINYNLDTDINITDGISPLSFSATITNSSASILTFPDSGMRCCGISIGGDFGPYYIDYGSLFLDLLDLQNELGNITLDPGESYTFTYPTFTPNQEVPAGSYAANLGIMIEDNGYPIPLYDTAIIIVTDSFDCNHLGNNGILISGLDTCLLEPGDILLSLDPDWDDFSGDLMRFTAGTYWGHAAIYLGDGKVAHAKGPWFSDADQLKVENLSYFQEFSEYWGKVDLVDWAVIRPNVSQSVKQAAVVYAANKANQSSPHILYNDDFLDPFSRDREDKFHCSGFVWKAYEKQGIDLEPNLIEMGFSLLTLVQEIRLVTPDDIYYSASTKIGKSTLVQQKHSGLSATLKRIKFKILSPADLLFIDEFGRKLGFDSELNQVFTEIPNSFYSGPESEPEFITITGDPGNLQLKVTGNDFGSYTLEGLEVDYDSPQNSVVRRLVSPGQIDIYNISKDIPYNLALNVEIDIKPGSKDNCLNINGHGIVPVAIKGSDHFDVSLIDPTSLIFGGLEVRVRGKRGPLCSTEDIDIDSFVDLICHFEDNVDSWVSGEASAGLTGLLFDGTQIEGSDSICIVP